MKNINRFKKFMCVTLTGILLAGSLSLSVFAKEKMGHLTIGNDEYYIKNSKLVVDKGQNKQILDKKVYRNRGISGAGNYVFYVKRTKFGKQGLCRLNLTTNKKKVLFTGKKLYVFNAIGNYVYYGNTPADQERWGARNLYVYDLTAKSKTLMTKMVGEVKIVGEKIYTIEHKTDVRNSKVYSFNFDGSGKKKIIEALDYEFKNDRIYYRVVSCDGDKCILEKYSCKVDGSDVKKVKDGR